MSPKILVRKASTSLSLIPVTPALVERGSPASERDFSALEWQGEVRLAAFRAAGISAPLRQQRVRAALFERALALGADHHEGPHRERPEVASRFLAHLDALAEAGLGFDELVALAEDAELDHRGALWAVSLLFGCLAAGDARARFEAWIDALDAALFSTYEGVIEIAEAIAVQPNRELRAARRWLAGASPILAAVALEISSLDEIAEDTIVHLAASPSPLVRAAIERLLSRSPGDAPRALAGRLSWLDMDVMDAPALAFQAARARLLRRDQEPLFRVRQRDEQALRALGPRALEVLAVAGDGSDLHLALALSQGHASTPALLDAMGRVGLPSLFARLLAALEDDELDDHAHAALTTALGPRVARPSKEAWERAVAALPQPQEPTRLRGGHPYSPGAIVDDLARPDLSARDVRARADEVLYLTGRSARLAWEVFGAPLDGPISELARLTR